MANRNIKNLRDAKRTEIVQLKKQIATALKAYKTSVENLKNASKVYKAASSNYELKASGKNKMKLDRATDRLKHCENEYSAASMQVLGLRKTLERKYDDLFSVCEAISMREANFEKKGFAKYNSDIDAKLQKLDEGMIGVIPIVSEDEANDLRETVVPARTETADEASLSEAAPEKEEAPREDKRVTTTVASVNVAPVTIDISPMVERAISAAMDKLNAGFERKIAEFFAEMKLPSAPAPAPVSNSEPVSDAKDVETLKAVHNSISVNNELAEYVLEEEKHIFDKLKSLCSSIQTLLDEIANVSGEYLTVATKQKEVAEMQKQVNDMQRYTMKEQQGVQVNQRIVGKDQTELVAKQTLLLEQQQALGEQQKSVADAQRSMADTQKAVTDTQSTIDSAMKSVLDSQRNLIASQQSIIQINAKNLEAAKRLSDSKVVKNAGKDGDGTMVLSKPRPSAKPDASTLAADDEFK